MLTQDQIAANLNQQEEALLLDDLGFQQIPNGTLVKVLPEPSPIWLVINGRRYGYTSLEKFLKFHKPNARVEVLADPQSVPVTFQRVMLMSDCTTQPARGVSLGVRLTPDGPHGFHGFFMPQIV